MSSARPLAVAGALLTGGVLVATLWVGASEAAGRDASAFTERRLPPLVVVGLVSSAVVVPLAVAASGQDRARAAGLTLAGTSVLLPLWSAWPALDDRWRVLALAAGPLAVAGLAAAARSWVGAAAAGSATLLLAAAYDPFRDPGCARVCVQVPAALPLPPELLARLVAAALLLAAAFTVGAAVRERRRSRSVPVSGGPALGAALLAALGVLHGLRPADPSVHSAVLLAAVPVPGLVCVPGVAAWARATRRRHAVRRLARDLEQDPGRLLALGARVDHALLSPGHRLALQDARLAAEARERLVEVRESQRRVVAAADAERRRIERDLHDGTQQRLVGILMQLAGRGHQEAERQLRTVLGDLRTFGDATFPPVLDEEGLEAALVELAATTDAELRLTLSLTGPVDAEQARAVYALVSQVGPGPAEVEVTSDPRGLDVVVSGPLGSAALDDVSDRFGALGGTLASVAGIVRGHLPCAP